MKEWIAKRVTEILGGVEDEVLIGYIFEMLGPDKVLLLFSLTQTSWCSLAHGGSR